MKFRLQGVTDLSTVDWPGRLATVIFLQGCNFRCPWCQNVQGVDRKGGREADTADVLKRVQANVPMVDSVVLTGGEPLLQPRACLELLKGAKGLGLARAIETNGSRPSVLRQLLPFLDFVAIDVKAPLDDPPLYARVIGSHRAREFVQKIEESVALAMESEAEVEVRTTVVPTLNDDGEIIARISEGLQGVDCLRLQQFRNQRTLDPNFQKLPSPSREELLKLARAAKREGMKNVKIFTVEGGLENV